MVTQTAGEPLTGSADAHFDQKGFLLRALTTIRVHAIRKVKGSPRCPRQSQVRVLSWLEGRE